MSIRTDHHRDDDLQQLYRRRKQQHPMPRNLTQRIIDKAQGRQQPRRRGWTQALPVAAASLVVVTLGMNWLLEPELTRPLHSLPESTTRTSVMESSESQSTQKPGKQLPPAAMPSDQARDAHPAAEPPVLAEFIESEAPRVPETPTPLSPSAAKDLDRPRYLRALPTGQSQTGESQFERCDGELYDGVLPQAPEGWFEIRWTREGKVKEVIPLDHSPCTDEQ